MERFALPTGQKEAKPSRLIPRDRWSTFLRPLLRPTTRSAVSMDSDFDDSDLRRIEGIAYNHTISTVIEPTHISCACIPIVSRDVMIVDWMCLTCISPNTITTGIVGSWSLLRVVGCPM